LLNKHLYKSNSSVWETPDKLFEMLNAHYHFTIDLCANENNHKLENYYSEDQDSLKQDWEGICWMNPPYGKDISKWVEKAYNSKRAIVVCLLPVRSDTKCGIIIV
jgi:phage N-6-adenine-methyltransferase